ncbi:MAG: ABC transporter permease [Lachnospiraceae bacterium]
MSFALLKQDIRSNALIFWIFFGVMLMYSVVMIAMFSPDSLDALNAMFEVLPPEIMSAMGFSGAFSTLVGYLASWLYGIILTAFPMVYSILIGNRLVAKTVDNGSLACILATPNSRGRFINTQAVFAFASSTLQFAGVFLVNILIARLMFPDVDIDMERYMLLNITVLLVNLLVMAITFFFSCLFNDSAKALGFGAGIPIVFLLLNMLGNASEDIEWLKNFSIYGWYDPVGIANGDQTFRVNLIYVGLILILYSLGSFIFKKKKLPL